MADLVRFFVVRPPVAARAIDVPTPFGSRYRDATTLEERRALRREATAALEKWSSEEWRHAGLSLEPIKEAMRSANGAAAIAEIRERLTAVPAAERKEVVEQLGDLYGRALVANHALLHPIARAVRAASSLPVEEAAETPLQIPCLVRPPGADGPSKKLPSSERGQLRASIRDGLDEFDRTPVIPRDASASAPQAPAPRRPGLVDRFATVIGGRLGLSRTSKASPAPSQPVESALEFDYDRLSGKTKDVLSRVVSNFRPTMPPDEARSALRRALADLPGLPIAMWDDYEEARIRPSGIADLLLIRTQTVAYTGAELTHIESAPRGEFKERTHRRFVREEDTLLQEEIVERQDEKDLQSTDRLDMRSEVTTLVKQDASLKAGASISASYGGMVTVSGSVDGQTSSSSQEATTQAVQFARETTTRAVLRLNEKRRRLQERRVIQETEETNKHGLDNKQGEAHMSALYQAVDRVVEAQVFNYGKRMMFDFVLPEPGWFLRNFREQGSPEMPIPPADLYITPDQLGRSNYRDWGAAYGVDLPDPPPSEVWVSKSVIDTVAAPGTANLPTPGDGAKEFELVLPGGYREVYVQIIGSYSNWGPSVDLATAQIDYPDLTVTVGRFSHSATTGAFNVGKNLLNAAPPLTYVGTPEAAKIAGTVLSHRVAAYHVVVSLLCFPTDEKMESWKEECYAKLVLGYNARLSTYREALEKRAMAVAGNREQSPPATDRLIRDELRKYCLMLFAHQYFTSGSSTYLNDLGHPELWRRLTLESEPYIRFLEEAFEWEYLIYLLYPYYWADQARWDQMLRSSGLRVDAFSEFIRAGAARVTVPVRPGFEEAVAHFLETGAVWNSQGRPPIGSPLYVSIVDELAKALGRPGAETPVGDPWRVVVPTGLVRLRQDSKLPEWEKAPDGTWREVPN